MWKQYIGSSVLYLFSFKDKSRGQMRYFCLSGKIGDPSSHLQLEVIRPDDFKFELIDPTVKSYKDMVQSSVNVTLPGGGYIFENMDLFEDPQNKQYVEEGLMFLGEYFTVTKFSEVKTVVSQLILQEMEKGE
jgi:hypothetical protein